MEITEDNLGIINYKKAHTYQNGNIGNYLTIIDYLVIVEEELFSFLAA